MKVLKDFGIDPRHAIGVSAKVEAALVGEGEQEVAIAVILLLGQRAGVEGHALVPSLDGLVVALGAGGIVGGAFQVALHVAVVDGISQLADHIHPNRHVRRALLGRLGLADEAELGEVGVAGALEWRRLTGQSRPDPVVGVLVVAVVVHEGRVFRIRTARAAVVGVVHLLLGAEGETRDGPAVQILLFDVVIIIQLDPADGKPARWGEASRGILPIDEVESPDEARERTVAGRVLHLDDLIPLLRLLVGLGVDSIAAGRLALDVGPLLHLGGEGRLELQAGVGLGMSSALVDGQGVVERGRRADGQGQLDGQLVHVDPSVIVHVVLELVPEELLGGEGAVVVGSSANRASSSILMGTTNGGGGGGNAGGGGGRRRRQKESRCHG
mmetsp:Transcript_22121/g.63431  ORF Transcript_22121/g.63431 Transcript_22121/m.63431 type:complete len:384 (-) Transcript_22121:132-1283(-)